MQTTSQSKYHVRPGMLEVDVANQSHDFIRKQQPATRNTRCDTLARVNVLLLRWLVAWDDLLHATIPHTSTDITTAIDSEDIPLASPRFLTALRIFSAPTGHSLKARNRTSSTVHEIVDGLNDTRLTKYTRGSLTSLACVGTLDLKPWNLDQLGASRIALEGSAKPLECNNSYPSATATHSSSTQPRNETCVANLRS